MSDHPDDDTNTTNQSEPTPNSTVPGMERVVDRISNSEFNEWYAEQQIETNILNGKAYFNGPSPPKDPERHTPSKLLQCHRKAIYARQNAPREDTPPEGLFWIGSEFEEEIIVPFLQDIAPDELYVQNSLWIDTTIEVDESDVQLCGSTDPAIVTEDASQYFSPRLRRRRHSITYRNRSSITRRSSTRTCTRSTTNMMISP